MSTTTTLHFAPLWEEFSRMAIPHDAPAQQYDSMKMAFYAGAFALLIDMGRRLRPGVQPTDKDTATLESIHKELLQYLSDRAVTLAKRQAQRN